MSAVMTMMMMSDSQLDDSPRYANDDVSNVFVSIICRFFISVRSLMVLRVFFYIF